ncbi:MAG: sigma-70 family RNA polymerase sigma factor [Weeksellaceae bacterium]|nr:sigma-70 family RNA polymerase sigma factor [Weeksellaceae bacterium]
MDEQLKILIRQCQENRREAQAEVYKRFSAQLFSVCLRYSNSYEEAQDVFQDGFILIFEKINQFQFKGSFEGWLRRIMVNSCIERHRKKIHLYVINDELCEDESVFASDDFMNDFIEEKEYTYNELLEFVRQLPDRYQQVFNLYVIDGFTHQQIAEMLHISVGTSKSNLSRARGKLMTLIKNDTANILSK